MRRRVAVGIATVVIAVAAFAAVRIIDSTSDNRQRAAEATATKEQFRGITAEIRGDSVCEVLVDIGSVPYSVTAVKSIRLTNATNAPLVLVDYSTQCRCMWLEFDRSPIAEGDSRDIELYFDSRGEWGSVGNYMEITTSCDDAPVVLWISAEVE